MEPRIRAKYPRPAKDHGAKNPGQVTQAKARTKAKDHGAKNPGQVTQARARTKEEEKKDEEEVRAKAKQNLSPRDEVIFVWYTEDEQEQTNKKHSGE